MLSAASMSAFAQNYTNDKAHSKLGFSVSHMTISDVEGQFQNFDVHLNFTKEDLSDAKFHVTADVNSINTGVEARDNHLKSAEFFDAGNNPKITFESSSLTDTVVGNLTINGVTKPVELNVEFGGINKDPWGNTKAGFSFEGKISRKDFGLNWNAALETGGVMVSDEVKIAGELQFVKA